jgi:putative ABC transport system substrate-binding protein
MLRSLVILLMVSTMIGVTSPALAANVAVIMSSKVDDYKEALRGFREVAKHRIVAEYDMGGDPERGPSIVAEIETKVKPDLILAVGIWALQAVLSQPTSIPVVYAMVLNPPSVVGDGKNVTGASMNIPVEETIRLFKQLGPAIKRIGAIFSRTRTGYLVNRAESIARHEGLQLVTREITSPREITAALESLQDQIDALWILPDEMTLTQPALQQILLFSYRRKIPVLGLSERHAQLGALLALSFASSEDIGRQAAELSAAVLSGTKATEIPYTTPRQMSLTVNLKTAGKLGIEVPKTILGRATSVIQ